MKKQGIIIHPHELTDQMIAILKKCENINVLGLHPPGGRAAAKNLDTLLELMKTPEFQNKLAQMRSLGIAIEYEMHALAWLLPRDLYGEHPEWFRRGTDGVRINDFNMCVSNDEALEYLRCRAAELARILKSDTGMYYFWADDVEETFCHCEKCSSLTPSDQAMIIYNTILEGIRRVEPEAKQCFLAYHETVVPPEQIRPAEGVFLEYAPMRTSTTIPINDENCEANSTFCSAIPGLLEWFGKDDAQILEYWMDNSMFSNWTKPPKKLTICADTIQSDIRFYREKGFEHITSFGCYLSDDYIELYGEPPVIEYDGCFV